MNNNIEDKLQSLEGKFSNGKGQKDYVAKIKLGFYEMSTGLNKLLVENNYLFPTAICFCKLIGL